MAVEVYIIASLADHAFLVSFPRKGLPHSTNKRQPTDRNSSTNYVDKVRQCGLSAQLVLLTDATTASVHPFRLQQKVSIEQYVRNATLTSPIAWALHKQHQANEAQTHDIHGNSVRSQLASTSACKFILARNMCSVTLSARQTPASAQDRSSQLANSISQTIRLRVCTPSITMARQRYGWADQFVQPHSPPFILCLPESNLYELTPSENVRLDRSSNSKLTGSDEEAR